MDEPSSFIVDMTVGEKGEPVCGEARYERGSGMGENGAGPATLGPVVWAVDVCFGDD